ncbi:hypothetical protein [Brevibacillus agri]|uniref:hypothetical protein n=1 Tax=Brevibacillus agri TaxID=51101 RepID=UPI001C8EE90F|nr:hypothetical protein [Brevibacillus agri]MBY0053056.1 hypothetical protein [Brevibacillus agri]MED1825897.1 hypothetical protein [Brevibacillus agri]MED4568886.1 hypothetical protein [Brevibacillus agri]WHX28453.1 hypothetical protein QNK09_15110 [Brevibacillus agri]
MGPFIGFGLLACLAITLFLAFERLIERSLPTDSFLAGMLLKTMLFLLVCALVYFALPWFSGLFVF